jgi:AcrR family transcriptional regulator
MENNTSKDIHHIEDKYMVRSTKGKIISTAVAVMSNHGRSGGSLREIAAVVGINPASIYNHFKSKEDILNEILDFQEETINSCLPDLDHLLKLCETEPPREVLINSNFAYPATLRETMERITVIATMEYRSSERCKEILVNCLLSLPDRFTKPMLERMIELERIQPMDVEGFLIILRNYIFSAATRSYSPLVVGLDEFLHGLKTLYTLVVPTGK